jgi:hypothetical protein
MKFLVIFLASSFVLGALAWQGAPRPAEAVPVSTRAMALPTFDATVHPRLLGSRTSFDDLAARASKDARSADLWKRTQAKASALLNTAPIGLPASGDVYSAAQTINDRTTTLSIALQVTGDKTYASRLWQEWSPVVQRTGWSSGNDLANATLAEAAAIAYDSALTYWDPASTSALSDAIIRESLTPAMNAYQAKSAWTLQAGNYNIVTNSGYALASLAVSDRASQLAGDVYTSAMSSLKQGMSALSGDGGFSEGYQYWTYAMQHLVMLGRALRYSTGSDQGVFSFPGMANTGKFGVNMQGPTGQVFDFGDSKPVTGGVPALFVLADEYSQPVLRQWAYEQAQLQSTNQFAFLWYRSGQPETSLAKSTQPLDARFAGNSVATLRSSWSDPDALFVATKTANPNNNGHPQLDAGTFVLDALGQRWATELGPDDYSLPGYFDGGVNGARWTYYRNRAEGHNTVVLSDAKGGPDQPPGAVSTFAQSRSSPSGGYVVSYLTGSATNGATTWKRGVALINGRTEAVVEDEIISPSPIDAIWSMHTQATVDISADGKSAVLTRNGRQLLARIVSPGNVTFSQTSSTPRWSSPNPAGQATNDGIRNLVILAPSITRVMLTVQFTPLHEGVARPGVAPAQPTSAWATTNGGSVAGIAVDGSNLSDFRSDTPVYTRPVVAGAVPVVAATATSGSSVSVVQATGVPGVATVTATAGDGTSASYRIYFTVAPLAVANATASASTTLAPLTKDGDVATKWVASGNQSLQYQLPDGSQVATVQIYWADPVPPGATFAIAVSDDAVSWNTTYSSSISSSGWNTYAMTPVKGRFIRLLTDVQNNPSTYAGVSEVRFFAQPGAKSSGVPLSLGKATVQLSAPTARVGDTVQATVSVTAPDGTPVALGGLSVAWWSADPTIATVTSGGVVTVKAAGSIRVGAVVTAPTREYLSAGAALTTTNPWLNTLKATADTYVSNATNQTTTNFGTSAGLFVKMHPVYTTVNREAYMRFDASRLVGKTVVSAKLRFVANTTDSGGTDTVLALQAIAGPWDEMSVSYATKPPLGSMAGNAAINSTASEYVVDLTGLVRDALTSSGGIVNVAFTEPSTSASLLALIYGKDSSRPPTLEITTAYVP